MGAFAFAGLAKTSGWGKYEALMADTCWPALVDEFRTAQLKLNGLPLYSPLELTMQAGLAALKSPYCGLESHLSVNCPTCTPLFARLAQDMPPAHRSHSCLVCRISGEVMNESEARAVLTSDGGRRRGNLREQELELRRVGSPTAELAEAIEDFEG